MEYFDVVDENGGLTGISKPRTEVHRDGDWHRTVHAWVLNGAGELLLQKRALNKDTNPGLWDVSAAGHLSAGEVSRQAVIKEVGEELGLHLPPEAFEYLFAVAQRSTYPDSDVLDNEIQDVYLVRADIPLTDFVVQTEEVAELRYITVSELERLVSAKSPELVRHDEEFARLFEVLRSRQ